MRLCLFDAVVLYGCACWTMTQTMDTKLQTTRRRMLRKIYQARRQPSETWVEYVRRATHAAEDKATSLGYQCWTVARKKCKWQFAGETARSSLQKWSTRLLAWRPWHRIRPSRRVGRPHLRWADELIACAGSNWISHAHDQSLWSLVQDGFAM